MTKITKGFTMSVKERRYRRISESFKKEKVKEIAENRATISDICRVNEVSYTAVYHWINLYSNTNKPHRTIVEAKSDTTNVV